MGAGEFKLLCRAACDFCESNLRFISGNRPGLLKDLSDLIGDAYDLMPATARSNPNSLFTFALMNLVQPLANYIPHSVLECAPYSTLSSMRLIIESLAVGLYADRWFSNDNVVSKVTLVKEFGMGRFRRCKKMEEREEMEESHGNDHLSLCNQYNALSREVNDTLDWLRGLLGGDAVDFIYEVYNDLSKPIHAVAMIDAKFNGRYVRFFHGAIFLSMVGEFPPMRTAVMPAECGEDDLVILDAIHWDLLLTRLSMDMLIYAWGVVTKGMSNGELEKAKAKIEEALKRIEEVHKELENRYRNKTETNH